MAAAAALALATAAGATPDRTLTLAVLPCTNIEATFQKFHPLIQYVTQSTGNRIKLVVPQNPTEFDMLLEHGQVDLALQDPHTYARLVRSFDPGELLGTLGSDGSSTQSGVVVVRRDSGITTLSQLRGRRVLFGPRASTSKWVAAQLLFERAGLDVGRDVTSSNGGCCEDIAFEVAIRTVDAGVVCDHFARLHEARQKSLGVDVNALRVVARTDAFPSRVLAARRGAPREAVSAVMRALVRLDHSKADDARVLDAAEIRAFTRTSEHEYLQRLQHSVPRRPR
jgi:phosphonate transport system substrate-binding protein